MHEKEKKIQDQRLYDATKNNYVGMEGKFGCILRNLGFPILGDTSWYESQPLTDVYEETQDEMPTIDEDAMETEYGWFFDGMNHGMHLEIKHMDDLLLVTYKGKPVYCEAGGQLECYTPFPEWETKIDKLHTLAKQRENVKKQQYATKMKETAKKEKANFIQRLRVKWGI